MFGIFFAVVMCFVFRANDVKKKQQKKHVLCESVCFSSPAGLDRDLSPGFDSLNRKARQCKDTKRDADVEINEPHLSSGY